MKISRKWKAI